MVSGLEERFLKEPPLHRSWSVPASILCTEGGNCTSLPGNGRHEVPFQRGGFSNQGLLYVLNFVWPPIKLTQKQFCEKKLYQLKWKVKFSRIHKDMYKMLERQHFFV